MEQQQQDEARTPGDGATPVAARPDRIAALLVCRDCRRFALVKQRNTNAFAAVKCTRLGPSLRGRAQAVRRSARAHGGRVEWLELLSAEVSAVDDGLRCDYGFALLGCHLAMDTAPEVAWESFDNLQAAIDRGGDEQTLVLLVALQGRLLSGTSLKTR